MPSPLLLEKELEAIKSKTNLKHKTLSLHYKSGKVGALAEALQQLCQDAEEAVKDGNVVLILSDRADELDPDMPPVPTLLAVGSVHHHLIRSALLAGLSSYQPYNPCRPDNGPPIAQTPP